MTTPSRPGAEDTPPRRTADHRRAPQILREYLVVATRPIAVNGLGLALADAVDNVRALRSRLRLLGEEIKVADRLLELLDAVPCTGMCGLRP